MSMKTLNNMDLIIKEMNDQLNSRMDFKGVKALSHSYETLLNQLQYTHDDFKNEDVIKNILKQKKFIENILDILETNSIPQLLSSKLYLEVNHLTTTVSRVNSIIPQLNTLLNKIYETHNPKIMILTDSRKGEELLYELIKSNDEEIIYQSSKLHSEIIRTDKHNYYVVCDFNERDRGMRFSKLYIDKDMSSQKFELAMKFASSDKEFEIF
ncbi:hypothetical protein QH639_18290 [Lysinibacillus sp. 1 U-2021]|uniref:hypothetical protein n=1 Tax=Lysinibacillus sp. 1 U-2021 TaxID=3039426 RepID=UPI002480C20A|nr:hypothetical protein [Lysinibacillus sp. 1 U-2021]WGT37770.1 hypothetical protein QH639_18290 [Lysinibacillus sp. 1 U-2021]